MGILINDSSRQSIIKFWFTLHIVAVTTSVIGVITWFSTPFFTRNVQENRYHQFFRWGSVAIGLTSGGSCLGSSLLLAELEPKVKALQKYELAQFKHSVASELHLAQQTNVAVAQAIVMERQDSLGLNQAEESYESYNGYDNENFEGYNGSNETNGVTEQEHEQVAIALADGVADSEIIKTVLKCGGAKYQEGKAKLECIKKGLNQEEGEDT
ncbi:MAG: hypothetical protein J7545_15615 [Roseofilum sp. SBFL]|uniref:hypothetical protein n=1 Tax=Roseofilum sp. SBFL TaxID=2821496 RepID=UPI001B029E7A|nr:hypothetical protein [Roseofilum sp. SBFL]MBP0043375.1 hypothetical protein [Roseofilum sp. SBFL]